MRSEYGIEDIDDFERMSVMKGDINDDIDAEEQDDVLALERSIMSMDKQRGKRKAQENEEPIEKYADSVRGTLVELNSGLAQDTNVENMVACVTNKYL